MKKSMMALLLAASLLIAGIGLAEDSATATVSGGEGASFAFRPAPINMTPEAENDFPYMGIAYALSGALQEAIASNRVFAYSDGIVTHDPMEMERASIEFLYVPEREQGRVPLSGGEDAIYQWEDFETWASTLPQLARISVYRRDLLEGTTIDALTGYESNEELGIMGGYAFYYSTGSAEASATEEELTLREEIEALRETLVAYAPFPIDDAFVGLTMPLYEPADSVGSFSTVDLQDNPVTQQVFSEAKLTMVNVWTTWCGPCIEELPHLAELSHEMADSGVQIIGVLYDALDDIARKLDPDAVQAGKEICEATGADYAMLIPDEALDAGLLNGIQGFPTTFFVDARGNTVGDVVVGSRDKDAWQAILEERLALVAQ